MRTLDTRAVRFGELAGPLVHGPVFFDWQLISTQEFADAIDYPFEELIAVDEIPYAPAATRTHIERYPTVGDRIAVETIPIRVGEHRIDLRYEFIDGTGDPFGVGQISHVTISPDGTAKPLPETVRANASEHSDGSERIDFDFDAELPTDAERTYGDSFRIRRPLIEGIELAYFEEYPRMATVALERYLEERDVALHESAPNRHPFQLRRWKWNFNSPVAYGTTLDVNATVVDISTEAVLVYHTFEQDGRTLIDGWTEYGCFDHTGTPTAFETRLLEAVSPD